MSRLPELEHELVAAAVRLRSPRRRLVRPALVAIGAALAAVAAGALLAIVTAGGSEDAAPTAPGGDAGPPTPDDVAPPRPDMTPLAGTRSKPYAFEAGGRRYTAQGFRTRQSTVCATLGEGPQGARMGQSCLSERGLRDALQQRPAHIFAGGGGAHGDMVQTGFARADVVALTASQRGRQRQVVLSPPWRPRSDRQPIRFFFVFLPLPNERVPHRWPRVSLTARLQDGRTIQVSYPEG